MHDASFYEEDLQKHIGSHRESVAEAINSQLIQ